MINIITIIILIIITNHYNNYNSNFNNYHNNNNDENNNIKRIRRIQVDDNLDETDIEPLNTRKEKLYNNSFNNRKCEILNINFKIQRTYNEAIYYKNSEKWKKCI